MKLPRRRKRTKFGTDRGGPVKCRSHLQWVRGFACVTLASGSCEGSIEAHHAKTRGAGGGDNMVVPICSHHHRLLDSPGWSQPKFERVYSLDLKEIAEGLWRISPAGIRWRIENQV